MLSPSSIRRDTSLYFRGKASAPVSALLLLHGSQQSGIEAGLGGWLRCISFGMALRGLSGSLGRSLVPAHLPRPLACGSWRRLLASSCEAVKILMQVQKRKAMVRMLHRHTLR